MLIDHQLSWGVLEFPEEYRVGTYHTWVRIIGT